MKKKYFKIGEKLTVTKKIKFEDIVKFAEISGDKNPLHLDEEYASKSIFKKRIAHGMLIGSYISAVLGNEFPGEGSIYLEQNFKFMKPVFVDDIITIDIEIINIDMEKKIIFLKTECKNQLLEMTLKGEAKILALFMEEE